MSTANNTTTSYFKKKLRTKFLACELDWGNNKIPNSHSISSNPFSLTLMPLICNSLIQYEVAGIIIDESSKEVAVVDLVEVTKQL